MTFFYSINSHLTRDCEPDLQKLAPCLCDQIHVPPPPRVGRWRQHLSYYIAKKGTYEIKSCQ